MKNNVLLGLSRYLVPVPELVWQGQVKKSALQNLEELGKMSSEAKRVRNYIVRELPRYGRPIPPEHIAGELKLPLSQVNSILDDLEKHMSFLYRQGTGSVVWAYPVTVDPTPHRAMLSSGESIFAA